MRSDRSGPAPDFAPDGPDDRPMLTQTRALRGGGGSRRLGVLAALAGACWLLSWLAAEALVVREELPHADAIVVLAGSSTYVERVRHAARLFQEGRAPAVVLTNDGLLSGWSAAEERNPLFCERAAAELRRLGVPAGRITIIPRVVTSTYEEASAAREYAAAHGLKSVLVVTTPYQSRRALWTLRRAFRDSGVTVGVDAPPPGEQSPHPAVWWLRGIGWKLVPGEYLKLIYYKWHYG